MVRGLGFRGEGLGFRLRGLGFRGRGLGVRGLGCLLKLKLWQPSMGPNPRILIYLLH